MNNKFIEVLKMVFGFDNNKNKVEVFKVIEKLSSQISDGSLTLTASDLGVEKVEDWKITGIYYKTANSAGGQVAQVNIRHILPNYTVVPSTSPYVDNNLITIGSLDSASGAFVGILLSKNDSN